MSNKILCIFLSIMFITTTHIRADEIPPETSEAQEMPSPEEDSDSEDSTPEIAPPSAPREVGKAAADGASTSKSSNIGTITIALVAVAAAVTAIILVSQHQGKHSSKK